MRKYLQMLLMIGKVEEPKAAVPVPVPVAPLGSLARVLSSHRGFISLYGNESEFVRSMYGGKVIVWMYVAIYRYIGTDRNGRISS